VSQAPATEARKSKDFQGGVAGIAAALGPFGMSTPLLKTICYHTRHVVAPESIGEWPAVGSSEAEATRAG